MKLFLTLAALAASAFAQRIAIGAPADRSTVTPGTNITVEVDKPNSLTGSTEIGIAIGLWPCGDAGCSTTNTNEVLGNVLYHGSYDPQYQQGAQQKPPHQNFSVQVPSSFASGEISLSVAHFSLVGAGSMPFMEVVNVTLIIP